MSTPTPASIAKHPIHPMLIVFPIGLWIFSFICDLFYLGTADTKWTTVALYTMIGGFIGALAAAIPGMIDLLSITNQRTKKIGITHMSLNLIIVTLYAINIWLRFSQPENLGFPMTLSLISVVMLSVSGWLGGEMVHVHGVGVGPVELLSNQSKVKSSNVYGKKEKTIASEEKQLRDF